MDDCLSNYYLPACVQEAKKRNGALEAKVKVLEAQLAASNVGRDELQNRINKLESLGPLSYTREQQLKKKIEDQHAALADSQARCAEVQESLRVLEAAAVADPRSARGANADLQKRLKHTHAELAAAQEAAAKLQQRVSVLEGAQPGADPSPSRGGGSAALQKRLKDAEAQGAASQEAATNLQERLNDAEAQLAASEETAAKLQERLDSLKRDLDASRQVKTLYWEQFQATVAEKALLQDKLQKAEARNTALEEKLDEAQEAAAQKLAAAVEKVT